MAPNYWSQTNTEMHGTDIKWFFEILLQKTNFRVYFLENGDLVI